MTVLDWDSFISATGPDSPAGKAITIGVFDGVHRGHQRLISRIVRQAPSLIPTVLTFTQNPKEILGRNWDGDLLSLRRKLAVFESLGVALTVLIDFSGNFNRLKGRAFLELLQGPGNLRFLVVGGNFRCGFGLDIGAAELAALNKEAGIPTEVADPVIDGAQAVSSSRIRGAIRGGELSAAAALLGRNVEIDVSDLPVSARQGGFFYDAASQRRIIPPVGRYLAVLYRENVPCYVKTPISIEAGGVFVPVPGDPVRIELITGL